MLMDFECWPQNKHCLNKLIIKLSSLHDNDDHDDDDHDDKDDDDYDDDDEDDDGAGCAYLSCQ